MTGRRLAQLCAFLAIPAVGAGCESAVESEADGEAARIEIQPRELDLTIGDTAWLIATVYDARGTRIRGPHIWYGSTTRSGPQADWTPSQFMVAELMGHVFFHDFTNHYQWHSLTEEEAGARARGMGLGEMWAVARSGSAVDSVPVRVRGHAVRLVSVEARSKTPCGLSAEGEAYCWGNITMMLGDDMDYPAYTLAPAPVARGVRFGQLTTGGHHQCGLTLDGEAYCWGQRGFTGALGYGGRVSSADPLPVSEGLRFARISAGGSHTCAITHAGELYCWGLDAYGNLGIGDAAPDLCGYTTHPIPCSLRPARIAPELSVVQVSAGVHSTCALTTDGRTYCWGINNNGQLGHESIDMCSYAGDVQPCSRVPRPVVDAPLFKAIAAGWRHTCGLTPDGRAFCWGHNGVGELGTGDFEDSVTPVPVTGGLRFQALTESCGLTDDGEAWCWGSNRWFLNGTTDDEPCFGSRCNVRPVRVSGGLRFHSISRGGQDQACGVTDDGVYCWGRAGYTGTGRPLEGGTALPLRVYDGRDPS